MTARDEDARDSAAARRAAALGGAQKYVSRGRGVLFTAYPFTRVAFWPGCSLAGTSPGIVRKTAFLLGEHFRTEVGIVLDCCSDPLHQLGETDAVARTAGDIRKKLGRRGIEHLILGCANCVKIFGIYLPEIRADYLLDVLPERYFAGDVLQDEVYLHHPCPAWKIDPIRERAVKLLRSRQVIIRESPGPQCCGLGMGAPVISPGRSAALADRIVQAAAGRQIVTYCMGCKNRLLSHGARTIHVLECLQGMRPLERPVGPLHQWMNRLMLAAQVNYAVSDPVACG